MNKNKIKLGELIFVRKNNINPSNNVAKIHNVFSIPAYDNGQTPEKLLGEDIGSNKYEVKNGDILFSKLNVRFKRVWLMNKCSIDNINCCTTEFLPLVVKDTNKVLPSFIYYFLKSDSVIGFLSNASSGTSNSHSRINEKQLLDVSIPLPPLHEQQKIANYLSNLDNQIELNNKINQELEEMAQTLYNYWFVQFEFPNKEGKSYKSNGGEMVWNEELKREIPEGWEVKSLLEIADFTNGLAMQKYRPYDGFASLPVIKIKEMKNGITSETERCKLDIPEKVVVKSGDILFSWSASLEVMLWTGEDGGLNQHIYKVVPKLDSKSFCYATLKNYLEYFRMIALSRKTTMGHITRDHLEKSFIAIPCEDVLTKFAEFTDVYLQQIISIGEQNQELAQLRDFMLPLLMNGQVTIED